VVLLVLAVRFLAGLFGDDGGTTVASRSTTTRRTIPPSTTTTRPPPPLPPGDDKTVKSVIDGDSFELTDGTKIRLIGIDAPDVETRDCFSAEATSHLKELLPADKPVRLVYDTTRTDRFERTLAYVYRLPDALFINVAMARDGFAREQNANQNTARQDEIATAVADARTANRGIWQSCSATTTTARSTATTATTAAPATSTTTTEPESTTTSTEPPTATTVEPGLVVPQGGVCVSLGATAQFSDGSPAVCTITADDPFPKWRPA
jgi:endonuclease YncB( thermonuclease family)